MTTAPRQPGYTLSLLVGALLVIAAGALHPHLMGDGAAQLALVAGSSAWRAIHWAFLFGFALCLTGLAGLAALHAGTEGERAMRAGLAVGTLAYAAWVIIVAFMAGTAWMLAQNFRAAEPGMTATRAIFLYDMAHPFALAAQRFAAFALGISTYLFGWGAVRGRVLPRYLGWLGIASGVIGIVLAVLFDERTRADQAAFVLPVLWQFVVAAVLLSAPAAEPPVPSNSTATRGQG
ncbi:MAG TPA: DUF4386 family protein [Gemmatimonadales bacterium]|nr:DUF4386 family protein [Gemmatimonadales bacterium]